MKKLKLEDDEQMILNELIMSYETREEIENYIRNSELLGVPEYQNILEFFEKSNITDKELRNMDFDYLDFEEDFDINDYL